MTTESERSNVSSGHEAPLANNPRMALQLKKLSCVNETEKTAVIRRAAAIRSGEARFDSS